MQPNFQHFKKSHRFKTSIFLAGFVFSFFLFLSTGVVEAAECACWFDAYGGCYWEDAPLSQYINGSKACLIRNNTQGDSSSGGWTNNCASSLLRCQTFSCPDYSDWNGENCYLRTTCYFGCNKWPEGLGAGVVFKWDASEKQCIQCNGLKESVIWGDQVDIYADCNKNPGPAADGLCESACGSSSACDEVTDGGYCASGKACSNGTCTGSETCNGCICVIKPTIGFSPSSFTFIAGYGGSNPVNQGLEIWNAGPSGSTLSWSVSDNATWLTLSPTSGISTGQYDEDYVWLSVNIAGLTYGNYSATITISDPNATNNPRTVPVTLTVAIPNLQVPSADIMLGETDGKVNYRIYNDGNWYTPEAGFYNSLYINGVYTDYQLWGYSLAAKAWTMPLIFPNWICTPYQTYSIKICADERNGASKMVTESNENDNCTTVSLLCPLECTGSINASPETATVPCDYTISISNVDYCQNFTWQVTRDGSSIGSGTVTSNTNWSRTLYDYDLGVDSSINYRLYIDGDLKDNDIVICQAAVPTTCAEAGGTCKASVCSTYQDCSSAAANYDCSGATPYCCLGSCVVAGNNPPTCNAGSDKTINENTSTTLDGSASDPDGDALTYNWACTGGSLNNSTILQPTYTAPSVSANTDYTCTLNVSDGKGGTCSDQMIVHVQDVPAGATIVPPIVATISATPNQTSATLNGILNTLGYNPATCTNCQCIVWFEWGTTGTSGVSGSYGNTTTSLSITFDNYPFTAIISGLTPGQTYYFEAFAKNGGSW